MSEITELLGTLMLIISGLLVSIFVLKRMDKYLKIDLSFIKPIKLFLMKHHKQIGVLLVTIAIIHGYLSRYSLLSVNTGTINLILVILAGLSFFIFSKINSIGRKWIYVHRTLIVLFLASVLIHINTV